MKKICFKCNIEKELSEYYKHKGMADGHLNKCKDCAKKDSDLREKKLRKDPEWIYKEKERGREKYYRLGYKNIYKPSYEKKKEQSQRYNEKYPEKVLAKKSSRKLNKICKSNHLHHWSYNKEHYKDVIELSVSEHNKLHRYIIYDKERMMYRRADNNVLLDTKKAHYDFYLSL
jgi:hypothetical protein